MPFALLVLLSAFLIEGIGTFVSVVGLSALFAANPVIIILAMALDLGKVVTVSFLYKYWQKINLAMRVYMTIAAVVLMIITSAGCFGYLSGQFQHAIAGTNSDNVVLTSMTQEQTRLQARKQEIDSQIAKLPTNSVRGRTKLMNSYAPEVGRINARLAEIDQQLPKLKVASIQKNTDVGPIIYVAQAFNTDPEHAVKWVIFTIIFVFDPLAIALLLAGNFLLKQIEDEKLAKQGGATFPSEPTSELAAPAPADEVRVDVSNVSVKPTLAELLEGVDPDQHYPDVWEQPVEVAPAEPDVMQDVDDDSLHVVLGRQKAPEGLVDQVDHLTDDDLVARGTVANATAHDHPSEALDHLTEDQLHAHLGRERVEDPAPTVINAVRPALPNEFEEREVITKDQLLPKVRSQLEDIRGNADVETDEERRASLSSLRDVYNGIDDETAPPIQRR